MPFACPGRSGGNRDQTKLRWLVRCLVDGSNHRAKGNAGPMHLCPVDLRKLQSSTGCDLLDRYSKLRVFYRSAGFTAEAEWLQLRISHILGQRMA